MSDDVWERATFAGTEGAQAEVAATLSVDERLALLEQLLEIAAQSGALEDARQSKQAAIDALWNAG